MIDYSRRSSSPTELAVGLAVGLASLVAPPPASAQVPLHPGIIAKTEQYMERFRTLVSEQAALPPGEADRNAYNSFVQELRGQGIVATEVCAAILDESRQLLVQVERGKDDALRPLQCALQCLYDGSPLRETALAEERISVPLRELALAVLHSRSEHVTVETRGMALSLAFGNFLEQQIPSRLMAGFLSAVE
ncbi:hypothetical protein MRY87_01545, partial [bacterium]|nr:hypothetical protein [bacterium]